MDIDFRNKKKMNKNLIYLKSEKIEDNKRVTCMYIYVQCLCEAMN